MKHLKKLQPPHVLALSLCVLLCALFTFFISQLYKFPNQLNLIAGQENRLSVSTPFEVVLENELLAVVNGNDEMVTENIALNLNEEVSIATEKTGEMDMTVSWLGLPLKKVAIDILPDTEVIPCGMTVGVRFQTQGIMVLGTGAVTDETGTVQRPSEGVLKPGDLILSANGTQLQTKEQLISLVEEKTEALPIMFKIKRDNNTMEVSVKPALSKEDNVPKLGVWVRDSTQGIGTITYYNPDKNTFGALGHGILDVDTKKLMTVSEGDIMESNIIGIRKGKKGVPGELIGDIIKNKVLGTVKKNTSLGLYGTTNPAYPFPQERMKIALQGQVHEGPATIRANISGRETKDYDVYIENVNKYSTDEAKGMVIRITDQELVSKTNGIVQGMSGSPIIQDGRLIGAVTHVFVQNPLKGYGIFIENMIKQERNM